MKKAKLLWKLFYNAFLLSAFTFGGGYVIISLMKKKYVDQLHWMEEKEMLDYTAIAQSSPGAVAVNAAILVGYRIAGVAGAAVSMLGTILPPFLILSVISLFYTAFRESRIVGAVLKGMQAGVAAVIADVVIQLIIGLGKQKSVISFVIMGIAFVLTYVWGVNVIFIILGCAAVGIIRALVKQRRSCKQDETTEERSKSDKGAE